MKSKCTHFGDKHWKDAHRCPCGPWDVRKAVTWNCDLCGETLAFGPSIDDPVERMAFAFLLDDYGGMIGGFPSTAFHDGYRNYNERIESWIGRSSVVDFRDAWLIRQLAEYNAGVLAKELEPIWETMQPRGKKSK